MSKTASECVRARGLSLKFACRCHGGCGSERLIPVVDIVTFVPRESMTSPSSGVYTVPVGRLPSASMWSPICVSGPRKIRYGSYRGATDGGKSRDRARQLPIASLTMLRLTISVLPTHPHNVHPFVEGTLAVGRFGAQSLRYSALS
jgi:hypothetical protein